MWEWVSHLVLQRCSSSQTDLNIQSLELLQTCWFLSGIALQRSRSSQQSPRNQSSTINQAVRDRAELQTPAKSSLDLIKSRTSPERLGWIRLPSSASVAQRRTSTALDVTGQDRRAASISTRRGSSNNHMLILKRSRSHWFSRAFLRTETHFPDSVNQTLSGRASTQENSPQQQEIEMPYWLIQPM